jgi:hypothetical protein
MTHKGRRFGYGDSKTTGRRRSVSTTGRTRASIEKESAAKYKDYVKRDIDASQRRRTALETMWRAEEQADLQAKKQAVEEYKVYMEGAPDPKSDPTGELRAAYMNAPLGKKVTGQMQAHIQASIDKSNRGDPNRPENRGPTQGEYQGAASVGERFDGYGRKTGGAAPATEATPGPKGKQKPIAVKLPNGSKGTVVAKEGNRVQVMDRNTRKTRWYKLDEVEMIETRGFDPLMGLT